MNLIICSIAFVLMASAASANDLTVNIGDRDVKLKSMPIHREITAKDKGKGGRNSATECSFMFYSLLAKGDIQGASKLATDPAKTAEMWTAYRERLGADDFKKEMENYFTSGNTIVAELVLGDNTMLVIKTDDGIMGQLYHKKDGKFVMQGMPFPDEVKALGKVLTMVQEGKIKL